MNRASSALRRFAAIFAAWTAIGLLIAFQVQLQMRLRGESRSLWATVAPPVAGSWFWALYTPGIVVLARQLRRLRERSGPSWRNWTLYFGAHTLFFASFTVVDSVVWAAVRPWIDGIVLSFSRVFALTLLTNVASYIAIVTLTEAFDYAARWRERERAAASLALTADELRASLDEARLHGLEAQLRPHFLYNTLNLIAELVHEDPDAADDMLTRLGLLLRRAYQDGPHLVPLAEELSFVRAYADILERRYRDRVTVIVRVPTALMQHDVPAYSLQPLVENAFRHGVERRECGTQVEISAVVHDATLFLRVQDRELGRAHARSFDASIASRESAGLDARRVAVGSRLGVGLRNTRERLLALYGPAAGLTLTTGRGESTAELRIPAHAARDGVAANQTSDRAEHGVDVDAPLELSASRPPRASADV